MPALAYNRKGDTHLKMQTKNPNKTKAKTITSKQKQKEKKTTNKKDLIQYTKTTPYTKGINSAYTIKHSSTILSYIPIQV